MRLTVKMLHDPCFDLDELVKKEMFIEDEQQKKDDGSVHMRDCLYELQLDQVYNDRHFISWMVVQK